MALAIAGMIWGHLCETMFDVAEDFVGGAIFGCLATWAVMREPLPALEEGSTVDGYGQHVALSDRIVRKIDRANRQAIEIAAVLALVGITLSKSTTILFRHFDNNPKFWPALEAFLESAAVTVTGGKGGRFL